MIEKLFHLKSHNTSFKTEALAGMTTFFTMCYILAINPSILGAAGMAPGAVFTATCLAAIIGTLIMAFVANWPVGLAPGMGLNGFFTYNIVLGMGFTWQEALGGVFISGVTFLLLTLIGVRKWITAGIPLTLRYSITAGIGLYLAFLALKNAGIIVKADINFIELGSIAKLDPLLTIVGFFIIATLNIWRVRGAILIGIFFISLLYYFFHAHNVYEIFPNGIVSSPPSISSTFLQLDLSKILHAGFLHILLVLVLVEILDATGCLISIGICANLIRPEQTGRLNRALFADSCAILTGSLLGTSSTTAYVESTSGIEAGGRTGLSAVFIALGFLFSLFLSPLILAIPATASAAALLFVACFMAKTLEKINWSDFSEFVPALLTVIIMPFSLSIANGIAFGFISYVILKLFTGQIKTVQTPTWIIALLFILRYAIK